MRGQRAEARRVPGAGAGGPAQPRRFCPRRTQPACLQLPASPRSGTAPCRLCGARGALKVRVWIGPFRRAVLLFGLLFLKKNYNFVVVLLSTSKQLRAVKRTVGIPQPCLLPVPRQSCACRARLLAALGLQFVDARLLQGGCCPGTCG